MFIFEIYNKEFDNISEDCILKYFKHDQFTKGIYYKHAMKYTKKRNSRVKGAAKMHVNCPTLIKLKIADLIMKTLQLKDLRTKIFLKKIVIHNKLPTWSQMITNEY